MLGPRCSLRTFALGLALTATGGRALAQPPARPAPAAPAAAPDYEAAKRHYQAGEQAAARGDHAGAAREYGIAYDITRDPVLFFKIGQSYDKAGDCRSARVYYGRYVKEAKPTPEYRERAEAFAAACVSRPAAPVAAPPAAAPPVAAPPVAAPPAAAPPAAAPAPQQDGELVGPPALLDDEQPSWQRTAAWTSIGFTIALGTTAAVLGLSAASREEDIQNLIEFRDIEGRPAIYTGATRDRYRDLIDEGNRLEKLSVVALAATGAAAAASVAFFLLDGAREADGERAPAAAHLAPAIGPGQAGLGWSGSF